MILLDIFFPKFCVVCKKWGRYVCDSCRKDIEIIEEYICPVCDNPATPALIHDHCRHKTRISGVVSCMKYNKTAKKIIKAIKYQLIYDIYNELAAAVSTTDVFQIFSNKYRNCYLQPVPLHPNRLKIRGFNQAEELAKLFSKTFQYPVINSLVRVKDTKPQAQINNRKQRQENIKDAFNVINKNAVKQKSVILVDDVYTSGSTCFEAAKVLLNEGAGSVYVWSLAKD